MVDEKKVYSKRVIEFMRKCALDGIEINSAMDKCVVEFENPFGFMAFKKMAIKYGIVFYSNSSPKIDDIDKDIVEFVEKSKRDDIYELRDDVIIKFEKDIQLKKLKTIIENYLIRQNAFNTH